MKSINVDWSGAYESGEWSFIGRDLSYTEQEQEDDPDAGVPMMNYAYPLYFTPSDEAIIKVTKRTNCTVVYNDEEDKHYLALTGGGMDLSQDIALAYIWTDGVIDWDMLDDVYITSPLSVSSANFKLILKHLRRQLLITRERHKQRLKDIAIARKALKQAK